MKENYIKVLWERNPRLSPQLKQKGLILLRKKSFNEDIKKLKNKWSESDAFKQSQKRGTVNDKIKWDIILICRKYNLYPASLWFKSLHNYLYNGILFPYTEFLYLYPYSKKRDGLVNKIMPAWKLPPKINCYLFEEIDKQFGEFKQLIQIFPDTTLEDIKRIWKVRTENIKMLNKIHHFYPLKNLQRGIKTLKTKKRKYLDYDYVERKKIITKETDLDIGTDILGDKAYDRLYRKRGRRGISNLISQTRYQYKKRLK